MKLGLVTAILEHMNFEEVIDFASKNDIESVELACWPSGDAERRYAGVSHIDVKNLTDEKVDYIRAYAKERQVSISALAYYPNPLSHDSQKREEAVEHLKHVIKAADRLDINLVTTFIGRDQTKSLSENFAILETVWRPLIDLAESLQVRLGIENCPMLFTEDEWPGGQNLMTSPSNWRKVFEILDSDYLGLTFDPSHCIWQQLDYIQPIYEFKDKLFFVHFKDIKLYPDKLADVGVMATPLEYMAPKLPGYGDVDWLAFLSALSDIKYNGPTSIEIEDKAFEGSVEEIEKSIQHSVNYMKSVMY